MYKGLGWWNNMLKRKANVTSQFILFFTLNLYKINKFQDADALF